MRESSISAPEMRCKVVLEATSHCDAQHLPNTPGCLPTPLPGPLPYSTLPTAHSLITQVCLPPSGRAWVSQECGFLTWPPMWPSAPRTASATVTDWLDWRTPLPSGMTLQRRSQGLSGALFPQTQEALSRMVNWPWSLIRALAWRGRLGITREKSLGLRKAHVGLKTKARNEWKKTR